MISEILMLQKHNSNFCRINLSWELKRPGVFCSLGSFFFRAKKPVAFLLGKKEVEGCLGWGTNKVEGGFFTFSETPEVTRDVTDRLRTPGHERSHCSTHLWVTLEAQIDDWFVASCTCCWILLGCMWYTSV